MREARHFQCRVAAGSCQSPVGTTECGAKTTTVFAPRISEVAQGDIMSKQFLVVKVARQDDSGLSVIPVPGLYDSDAAEEALNQLQAREPASLFMIQEVGAA